MTVSGMEAAKRACEASGWTLSNLALQKILYLAHMIYLGRHGSPLISDRFEAWDYGPVLPQVYRRAKAFGSGPIQNVFHSVTDIENTEEADIINEAVRKLGDLSPGTLVAATHRDGGAWARYYQPGLPSNTIPNDAIRTEYETEWNG
ncbi:Panacea domain-containing protein [Arhodomonas aquaeolei]|uniref:Panacea domain-containing protein n=1 Tax=Arhodomonas aquaeolei TaxID=2369 RepID=UPI0009FCB988|nr:type II toxin-antitoxin system antitoxin SocA domain-containing protein [Arhodomonas aquaeolei]